MERQNRDPKSKPKTGKSELRVCHLADIHLGYRRYNRLTRSGFNQREADVNHAFHETVDRIINLKPNLILIAGDLFHTVRPSNAIITSAFREIRRLVGGTKAPLVLVAGNHETPKRVDSGSVLRLFAEIDGVFVADSKAERFTFPDIDTAVMCLPHAALKDLSTTPVRADDRFAHNILVAHGQLDPTWVSEFAGVEINLATLSPHEWDYIALGHVHEHKKIGLNAAYSGAIEHTGANIWAESRSPKGFLDVQLPKLKLAFQTLTSPREVFVLEPIDAAETEAESLMAEIKDRFESIKGGLDGKIVRLEVRNARSGLIRQLNHKELRNYRAKALNLSLDFRPPQTDPGSQSSKVGLNKLKLLDAMLEFCGTWPAKEPSPAELSDLMRELFAKLEVEDEARQS